MREGCESVLFISFSTFVFQPQMNAWGSEFPAFIRDINAERRWHAKPIAPLGVTLKMSHENREKWGRTVDFALVC